MNLLTALLVLLLAAPHAKGSSHPARIVPTLLDHESLFSTVETTGAEFSPVVRALEGTRVRFCAYSLFVPRPDGGLYLTRTPEARLHPDDEETLPWDAVGVLFRKRVKSASIPRIPVVEGTLHLGNRKLGDETVILLLDDAVISGSASSCAPAETANASVR